MQEILWRLTNLIQRVQYMDQLSTPALIGYSLMLVFGIMNCILGYRLLRFWMMLSGFVMGSAAGFAVSYYMGFVEKYLYAAAMLAGGILVALLAFLIYKIGILVIGIAIGATLSIYVLHPTTSVMLFVCILIGIGTGVLAMRFVKGVLIFLTSVMGGVLSGFSLAKLSGMPQMPIGIAMIAAFTLLGLLLQFAINRDTEDEDDEEEELPRVKSRREELEEIENEEEYLENMMREDLEWEEQRKLRKEVRRIKSEENAKKKNKERNVKNTEND